MTHAYSLRLDRVKWLSAVSTLALSISLFYSGQAFADCSGTAGTTITCENKSEVGFDNEVDFSAVNPSPAAGNISVKVTATPANDGEAELENEHTISATINTVNSTNHAFALYGIRTGDDYGVEEFELENSGTISAIHKGIGEVAGVFVNGDAEAWTIENSGTISVERGDVDIDTTTITSSTPVKASAAGSGFAAGTLGVAAAIYNNEEEVRHHIISNEEAGKILASGTYSVGIYSRSSSLEINNEGEISASGLGSAAIVSWDGRLRKDVPEDDPEFRELKFGKTFIDNSGEINGNIIVSGARGTQIMAAIATGVDPNGYNANASAAIERRDSEITNTGEINGSFYLQNGHHVVDNAGGTIDGSIVVDQRRAADYSVNANALNNPYQVSIASREDEDPVNYYSQNNPTNVTEAIEALVANNPEHHFEFENSGVFTGSISVFTYQGAVSSTAAASFVELRPHITGTGAGSDEDHPSDQSGYIAGTLGIGTGSWAGGDVDDMITTSTITATNTVITPVIDSLVHSGEYFLVANELVGSALPGTEGTVLVSWEAAKNSNNALVIGSTVADSSVIAGLTKPGAAALDGLLNSYSDDEAFNALGGAIQNSNNAEEIRKASEQLSPDTSFGVQQSAWTLAALQGSAIDARIGSSGSSGGGGSATTGFSQPSGLGMGNGDAQRSNLGATQGSYGPSREGAWGQAFGAHLDDDKDPVNGAYAADIYGFVAGYDNVVSPGFRVGGAFGYGQTDIKEKGDRSGNTTDADSYTATAYAALKGAGWYMTGRTGFTWHDYDTLRKLSAPFSDTATGSHEGRQYTASAEVGAPTRMAGAVVTPLASLTYNNLDQDSYTERSGGGMALDVASQQNDSLVSGLGLRALVPIASGTVFEGRAIWLHEFADTNQVVTASFIGADTSFTAGGADVGRDTANLGAALTIDTGAGYSFQANYDAFLREDFVAHAGSGRILVRF